MTIYDQIQAGKNALENIRKNIKDLHKQQEINTIISKLTVALYRLKDKTQTLNENLQGGIKDINSHLRADNNVEYCKSYNNSYIQNIQDLINKAEEIIREAGSNEGQINDL